MSFEKNGFRKTRSNLRVSVQSEADSMHADVAKCLSPILCLVLRTTNKGPVTRALGPGCDLYVRPLEQPNRGGSQINRATGHGSRGYITIKISRKQVFERVQKYVHAISNRSRSHTDGGAENAGRENDGPSSEA